MAGINISKQAIKCLILNSWFITIIIFIQPLLIGRLIIKLIKISFYFQSGIGSGFKKPLYILYKALAYQQIQQLKIYLRIILCMFGQQYFYQSRFKVFPQPRQLATSKLCTYSRSLSLSLLQSGTLDSFSSISGLYELHIHLGRSFQSIQYHLKLT